MPASTCGGSFKGVGPDAPITSTVSPSFSAASPSAAVRSSVYVPANGNVTRDVGEDTSANVARPGPVPCVHKIPTNDPGSPSSFTDPASVIVAFGNRTVVSGPADTIGG